MEKNILKYLQILFWLEHFIADYFDSLQGFYLALFNLHPALDILYIYIYDQMFMQDQESETVRANSHTDEAGHLLQMSWESWVP